MLLLIAGITGNMGRRLAVAASTRGIRVRGLGRNASNAPAGVQLDEFVECRDYFDPAAVDAAVQSVDAVICAYASTPVLDLDAHLVLLRAAERAGVRIFVSASWNNDWTKNTLGQFEHYDAHIAFRHHATMTSSVKPVYVFNGFFADLLFTPTEPGGWDDVVVSGEKRPVLRYWGHNAARKFSWTTQEDAAAWTIDLLFDEGVRSGGGGVFRFRSGEASLGDLAAAYQKATGVEVGVVRAGALEELEVQVADLREQKGVAGYWEYALPALALNLFRGVWDIRRDEMMTMSWSREPTTLEEYLRVRLSKQN